MKAVTRIFAALFLNLALLAAAQAEEMAVKAQAMVERAVAYVQENGPEKAYQAFNTAGSEFFDGELYIFAYNSQGTTLALGAAPSLVGKDLSGLKSADGKLVIQDMIALAREQGEAWYEYDWAHPETRKVQHKRSFVKLIPGTDVFVGCGYYSAL